MKMEDAKEIENARRRAEVFDALGHPTRIVILKVLSEVSLGFAELKKKTGIESSGHLQHHLNKLDGLIKTDEYGKYCLSDQGKDALLTVQTVENVSSTIENRSVDRKRSWRFGTKIGLTPVALLLAALLITSSAIALFEYNQASVLQKQIDRSNTFDLEAMAYYSEFGVIPSTNVNSSFAPPVSMYRALQTALEAEGWNKTTLTGMRISAYLTGWRTITNPLPLNYTRPINLSEVTSVPLTTPPSDYSSLYSDGVVYRYVWQIVVQNSAGITIPPLGFTLIDAATGQIVPNPQHL